MTSSTFTLLCLILMQKTGKTRKCVDKGEGYGSRYLPVSPWGKTSLPSTSRMSLSSPNETLYPSNMTLHQASLPPSPWSPPLYFCLHELDVVPPISGIIPYLSLCNWLIALIMRSSTSIYVAACVRTSFLFFFF